MARTKRPTVKHRLATTVRPIVEGGEEALTSAAIALTGLAGLDMATSGSVDPLHVTLTTLAANGASHIISSVNGVRAERAAARAHNHNHNHNHGQHDEHTHGHHGHSHFTHPSATVTGIAGVCSYTLGLALPVTGYLTLDAPGALAGSALGFLGLGAAIARFTKRGGFRSAVSQLMVGIGVMATTLAATTYGAWERLTKSGIAGLHDITDSAMSLVAANPSVSHMAAGVAGGLAVLGLGKARHLMNRRPQRPTGRRPARVRS